MIIGRGTISQSITDRDGFTFFCTGASNREPITDRARQKELNHIWRISQDNKKIGQFVYFSSLCIYYSASEYSFHKRDMENLVKRSFDNYCIVRIGNLVSEKDTNPNTIINHFKNCLRDGIEFEVQDTYRYLVDADELNHWVEKIPPTGKHEFNITGKRVKVDKIVELIKGGKL